MESKPLALIIAFIVTVGVAAGGGAWLALRQNDADRTMTPGVAEAQAALTAGMPDPDMTAAVHETEAVIEEPATAGRREVTRAEPAASTVEAARPAAPAAPRTPARAEPARSTPAPVRTETVALETTWPSRAGDRETARDMPAEPSDLMASLPTPLPTEPAPLPEPFFEEITIPAEAVIGLQVDTPITTELAAIEDRVEARVTRDVRVGDDVVIPAGTRAIGSVTLVEPGGKIRERARLGVRFHTVVMADGASVAINTDTIYREGDSPAGGSTARIGGGAVGGAIIGAILGGTKGAVMGGAAGAGAGTAATMAGDRNAATLPAGTSLTVRLRDPVAVEIER